MKKKITKFIDIIRGKPRTMFSKNNWKIFIFVHYVYCCIYKVTTLFQSSEFLLEKEDKYFIRKSAHRQTHVTNEGIVHLDEELYEKFEKGDEVVAKIKNWNISWKFFVLFCLINRLTALSQKGLYQRIDHPLFKNKKHHRGSDRKEILDTYFPSKLEKTVLDIGSNMGLISQYFLKKGASVTAVEANYLFSYISRVRLSKFTGHKIVNASVFALEHYNYDVIVALSIFHHFLRTEATFRQFVNLLNSLNCNEMVFEPHSTDQGFSGSYVDFTEDEFCMFIIENSHLTTYTKIGTSKRGRPIYILRK
ncbi:class I SAM-dependent methyltransferase [Rhodobacteraceae bacterium nBUS_24]